LKIAVCVKYVPVVSRIQFDYVKKTIIREGVPSEINPFDLLGLVRAVELKHGPDDEVVAVSMGPPQAREGLVQCLALGADRAILLTDRALAGSDTLATARALSLVLQREKPDLVICGRNSADAETGQVGPEIAELMGLPHVGQVRKLDLRRDSLTLVAERVTDEGYQVIECPLPAVACVTEGVAPETYPSREQLEGAQSKPLEQMSCAQLSADASQFGAAGSPTWVQDIRLVEPGRLGVVIEGENPHVAAQRVAGLLRERLAALAESDGSMAAPATRRYPDSRGKSVWVVAETSRNGLRQVTLEMLGKARELTSFTKSEVAAVVIGGRGEGLAGELAAYGADRVLVLDNSKLGPVYSRSVAQALAGAVKAAQPYAVLFASTADGRDLASRIAARLGLGLTGDAIDLEVDEAGRLVQLKPALGGNVVAPILSKTLPNLVTLRPGLLTPISPGSAEQARVERIEPSGSPAPADIKLLEEHFQEDLGAVALTQSQVVLAVGMGIGGPENLPLARELARSLGATIATTRNVVHSGWLPHQIQVGISGRAIAPKVYLAVGIRGAFNHTVGIQKAGVIIAVNQNRRAAIFKAADFGIVGDWREYLPPLAEALQPILEGLAG
jgi:electron transfer flavoprotein alpha subunit